jgi:hypothetical protein
LSMHKIYLNIGCLHKNKCNQSNHWVSHAGHACLAETFPLDQYMPSCRTVYHNKTYAMLKTIFSV